MKWAAEGREDPDNRSPTYLEHRHGTLRLVCELTIDDLVLYKANQLDLGGALSADTSELESRTRNVEDTSK